MKKNTLILYIIILFFLPSHIHAEIIMPRIFGDHMVLQRERSIQVWGWADVGEKVAVSFNGKSKSTVTDNTGRWMLQLPAMKADAEGKEFIIKGKNEIVFQDVVVGEVWLCSGQSNMDWPVRNYPTLIDEGKKVDNSNIRFIRVKHYESFFPAADFQPEQPWSTFQNEKAIFCTAVGFYFGMRLQRELDIPIGLIDAAWSGTTINWWIPPAGWQNTPELKNFYDTYQKDINVIKDHIASYADFVENESSAWIAPRQTAGTHIVRQSAMYNGLIAPLMPYGIRGMIWYQGETDADAGDDGLYYYKQHAMIDSWRKAWGQGDFSFYFTQLANMKAPNDNPEGEIKGWQKFREAQTKSLDISNSGMACIIDIGDPYDAHFKNKFDVGERLALWALAKDYGKKNIVYSGPIYKEMRIEGNKIRISFDHIGSGLMVGKKEGREPTLEDKGGKLKHFAIAGADQEWVWADAMIEGETVVVSSLKIENPVAVRYAWSNNPEGCNLYNKDGLPASPFRTDNW